MYSVADTISSMHGSNSLENPLTRDRTKFLLRFRFVGKHKNYRASRCHKTILLKIASSVALLNSSMLTVLKWRANLGVTVFPVDGGPIAETIWNFYRRNFFFISRNLSSVFTWMSISLSAVTSFRSYQIEWSVEKSDSKLTAVQNKIFTKITKPHTK